MQACALPFALIANEDKAVWWMRERSPSTFLAFRVTGDDWGVGAWKVAKYRDRFKALPADVFSLANEWSPDATPELMADTCQDYVEAMDAANEAGFKITIGDFSERHPNLSRSGILDAMRPMLAKAEREGHYLNVHVYLPHGDASGWPEGLLWREIVKDYPRLKVIIGELGILENDGTMTAEGFANLLAYDALLTDYPQVVGAALYTLTDSTWLQCRWDAWIDVFAAHIKGWQ